MLNRKREDPRGNKVVARTLTDDPLAQSKCLGCHSCLNHRTCGGLHVEASLLDCLDLCCGTPEQCSKVCANNPTQFISQCREINGFDLQNTPRAPARQSVVTNDIAPLIYHGSCRKELLSLDLTALRLADVIDFGRQQIKYSTREQLCRAFKLNPTGAIILTGVDHDARIEPWWSLGKARVPIIQGLVAIGIRLITTPNFSVVLDHPRTDDLHAIKRIAIVFSEFLEHGMACALHPNGRTLRDFERWGEFIASRPEVETLAYEFITGPGRLSRMSFHLDQLAYLARAAGRPLSIVVRGDPRIIPVLRQHFKQVTYVDTTSFIKTLKRRAAKRTDNISLKWHPAPTSQGEHLDELLYTNVEEQRAYLRTKYFVQHYPMARVA